MSDDRRCHARIVMKNHDGYMVFETFAEIVEELELGSQLLELQSWAGSDLMPPAALALVTTEIATIQELSLEDWTWSKHATELHYAQRIRELESTDQREMIAAQQRLVDAIEGTIEGKNHGDD